MNCQLHVVIKGSALLRIVKSCSAQPRHGKLVGVATATGVTVTTALLTQDAAKEIEQTDGVALACFDCGSIFCTCKQGGADDAAGTDHAVGLGWYQSNSAGMELPELIDTYYQQNMRHCICVLYDGSLSGLKALRLTDSFLEVYHSQNAGAKLKVLSDEKDIFEETQVTISTSAPVLVKKLKKNAQDIEMKELGKGSYGIVYSVNGVVAVKMALSGHGEILKDEFRVLQQVLDCSSGLVIKVPQVFGFFSTGKEFAEEWGLLDEGSLLQGPLFVMEEIPALDSRLQKDLQGVYHPRLWSQKRKRLCTRWRLYLGADVVPPPKTFFQAVCVLRDKAEALGLSLPEVATDMGRLIGRVVFRLGYDCSDVEFLLAGGIHSGCQVYCVDFGLAKLHHWRVESIANAIVNSQPYYPKHGTKLRLDFENGFLEAATGAGREDLCKQVLAEMESIVKRRSSSFFLQLQAQGIL